MTPAISIDAGACVLRQLRASDASDLAAAANHREVWRNVRDAFPHPYTRACAETWIDIAAGQDPVTDLAITVQERVVGGIGAKLNQDVHRFSAEIGFWLAPLHWQRGLATAALMSFAPWIMERQGLRRLYAEHFAWNSASGRVLQKCGFEPEGLKRCAAFKDGQFVDVLTYGLVRGDGAARLRPPR
jgi:[ribosomal protein S5]-alanine N-acetyltransferase